MKIIRNGYVNQKDIEIRSMIGAKNISTFFVKLTFPFDRIKDSERNHHKIPPYFFQFKNQRKPFAAAEKDEEERK
jgi:hypothetical protein